MFGHAKPAPDGSPDQRGRREGTRNRLSGYPCGVLRERFRIRGGFASWKDPTQRHAKRRNVTYKPNKPPGPIPQKSLSILPVNFVNEIKFICFILLIL